MKKFLLILFAAFLLCACLPAGAEPSPPVSGWVKLEENKLRQGEDFEVTITCSIGPECYRHEYEDIIKTEVTATLQMSSYVYDKSGETRELYAKKMLHTMNDEQFRTMHDRSPEKDYFGITETITIPHDWFAGDQGAISWTLKCELYTYDREYDLEF